MRIEIDTNADSKESLKKVLRLLQDLVDEQYPDFPGSASLPKQSAPASSEGFFNLFGPVDAPSPSPPASQPSQASESLFDVFKQAPEQKPQETQSGSDDGYYHDAASDSAKPERPKKWSLPDDRISVIDY